MAGESVSSSFLGYSRSGSRLLWALVICFSASAFPSFFSALQMSQRFIGGQETNCGVLVQLRGDAFGCRRGLEEEVKAVFSVWVKRKT